MENRKINYSNWASIVFLTILLLFNATSIAQQQISSHREWKLIKTKKKGDGWKLYKRKVPGAQFQEAKIVGQINASMQLAQSSSMQLFVDSSVYVSKKGKSLGWFEIFKQTENEIELYSFMKGNFLYKDRDVVVRYNTFEDADNEIMGVKWHHINKEGYEARDSIIRMPVDIGNWSFNKLDSEACMAEMTFQFHPGGSPPAWLINMIVKYYAPHEFEHLKKLCEHKHEAIKTAKTVDKK